MSGPGGTPPEAGGSIDEGVSEFGERLAGFLQEIPTAHGAVLTDSEGDAIDWARRVERIDTLEVQLLGAQIGVTLGRLDAGWRRLSLGAPTMTVWADRGVLVARPVLVDYLLCVRVEPGTNYEHLVEAFERAAGDVLALIG